MREVLTWPWSIIIIASLVAGVWDMRTGRIPNILTLGLAGAGLILAAWSGGLSGLADGVIAWVVVALPYIVLFALGRGGAGDAKMMGAIGPWLGLRQGIIALGCVAIVGGVLAILRILWHGERRIILRDVTASLFVSALALAGGRKTWSLLKADSQGQAGGLEQEVTIPYGIAIFLGLCLAAFVVHV